MSENVHTAADLKQMQSLSLESKINMTKQRIKAWYEYWDGNICVSFSGGKDSTVLKHIVDSMYENIPAVFVNTGLEYPEIQNFVREIKDGKYNCFNNDVEILRPKMRFDEVIRKYGYPIGTKRIASNIEYGRKARARGDMEKFKEYIYGTRHNRETGEEFAFMPVPRQLMPLVDSDFKISSRCCYIMKKSPLHNYQKQTGRKTITGTMACESKQRADAWLKTGCNGFDMKDPISKPLSFWTEQDILHYIKKYEVPYCPIYGDIITIKQSEEGNEDKDILGTTGASRSGCVFCMFGLHSEKEPNRFQRMKETHPIQYGYCMKPIEEGGLGLSNLLDYVGIPYK